MAASSDGSASDRRHARPGVDDDRCDDHREDDQPERQPAHKPRLVCQIFRHFVLLIVAGIVARGANASPAGSVAPAVAVDDGSQGI